MTTRPLFIVIEGLDGSGGTTQSRLLQQYFQQQNQAVVLTNEPTRQSVGRFIKEILLDPHSKVADSVLAYLFAADREDHVQQTIFPALKQGSMVISDRYYHSSLAYQSLSLDFDFVHTINSNFPKPDITFFLYLEPEISFERVQLRGLPVERFETLDKLRSIANSYKKVLDFCQQNGEHIVEIDAKMSIEEIHQLIISHVATLLAVNSVTEAT